MTDDVGASGLKVGDTGYYRVRGEYYPARVVADDIVQTFGPIDRIIAYRKFPGFEATARIVNGGDPCNSDCWVSAEEYERVRLERRRRAIEDFDAKMAPAQGMETRKGGDGTAPSQGDDSPVACDAPICRTCSREKDDPDAWYCSDAFHLPTPNPGAEHE